MLVLDADVLVALVFCRMRKMPFSRWEASGWVAGRSGLTGPRENPQHQNPPMKVSSSSLSQINMRFDRLCVGFWLHLFY